jgi:hypothetical protein
VQLSLNFLTSPHHATPLERLEPGQRAELLQALARIITKAARPRRAADDRGDRDDDANGGNPP